MLGSSFGSTGPGRPDAATGRPYGPDFSRLTLADIVAAQRRLVKGLGVRQIAAVVATHAVRGRSARIGIGEDRGADLSGWWRWREAPRRAVAATA